VQYCSNGLLPLVDFKVLEEIESHHFPIMTKIEGKQLFVPIKNVQKIIWDPDKADSFADSFENLIKNLNCKKMFRPFQARLFRQQNNNIVTTRKLGTQHLEYGPKWFDKACVRKNRY
jgi:hypothetical protein